MPQNYDRLSALDATFLGIEEANYSMHVGGVLIFEGGPLRAPDGSYDIDRVRRAIAARLHLVPRFRQRIAYVPYENHPVWIDDERFRLAYHVRHAALPRPGDERELKRLVGRIMSTPLDRARPLWEFWFVEGLEGDRVVLINKTHHAMIDGVSGADLVATLMSPVPTDEIPEPEPWKPRPRPTGAELGWGALARRFGQSLEAAQAIAGVVQRPVETFGRVAESARALGEYLAPALRSASTTPLNVEVGPHRRFDWLDMKIAELKAVKNALGGTLNDVVLALVSGALRQFFARRGFDPATMDVRAMCPVNVRAKDEHGAMGNRVAQMVAPLPVAVADPVARLQTVTATMGNLKESRQALGAQVMTAIGDWTTANLLVQAIRLSAGNIPYNLIVTNVPGPQLPLYFLGYPMLATYPVVPLFKNMALVIGLFSFNGGLYWGLNADWEQMPDLHDLVGMLEESFRELRAAAERAPAAWRRPADRARPR